MARSDLVLHRARIAEPARYYDTERAIVVRRGLLLEEERRYLWHELVHADRRDRQCHADGKSEDSVEREAVRRALPLATLLWAFGRATSREEVVDLLKLPADWIQYRLNIAHPAERALIRRVVDDRQEGVA